MKGEFLNCSISMFLSSSSAVVLENVRFWMENNKLYVTV